MRRFEEQYRIQEADDILRKEDAIHQDLDLRLDAVEQDAEAFRAGNRADIEAILKSLEQTFGALAAEMRGLLDQTVGGLSADIVVETTARYFLTDTRRAAILADLRGGVDASGDTMAKLLALIVAVVGGAPAGRQSLKAINDAVVANTATLAAITGGADPTLDSFAEALTRFVIDEGQISSIMTMLGKRVRVDGAQAFSGAERRQAKQNAGALGAAAPQLGAGTVFAASDLNKIFTHYSPGGVTMVHTLPPITTEIAGDRLMLIPPFAGGGLVYVRPAGSDTLVTNGTAYGYANPLFVPPGSAVAFVCDGYTWYSEGNHAAQRSALNAHVSQSFNDAERSQLLTNAGLLIPQAQCRLVRNSATQLQLVGWNGNQIWINGAYRPISNVLTGNNGLSANQFVYGFAYWTGSAVALALGIAAPTWDPLYGIRVANGQGSDAANRVFTYVGAILTDANGQFRDDDTFRGVASLFNPPRRTLAGVIAAGGSTASPSGAVLGSPLQFALAEPTGCRFGASGNTSNDTAGKTCRTDITLDQVAAGYPSYGDGVSPAAPEFSGTIPAGAHAVNLFASVSGGTGQWNVALFGELG